MSHSSRMRYKFDEKPLKKLTTNLDFMVKPGSRVLVPYSKLQQELETYKHRSEIKPRKHNIMKTHDLAGNSMGIL